MIRATGSSVLENDLFELLTPEVRGFITKARDILDEGAVARASTWKYEEPLREWETRARAEAPKGRTWKALLEECVRTVAEASRVHLTIYEKEREALPHLKAALVKLRLLRTGSERSLPSHTVTELDRCVAQRGAALMEIDELLEVSERIVTARSRTPPEEIFDLLAERRRHLGDANSLKAASDAAERRAFQEAPDSSPDLDEVAERAVEEQEDERYRRRSAPEADADAAREARKEGLRDEEWEAWLASVGRQRKEPDSDPNPASTEPVSDEDPEWENAIRQAAGEPTAPPDSGAPDSGGETEETGPGIETEAEPAPGTETTVNEGSSHRAAEHGSLLSRVESLAAELRKAEREAEEEREHALALMADEITRLKNAHAEAITAEIESRRKVEKDLAARTTELEETRAAVEKTASDLERTRTELEETRLAREEIDRTAEALTAERDRLEEERQALLTEREELASGLEKARKDAEAEQKRAEREAAEVREKLEGELTALREEQDAFEKKVRELEETGRQVEEAFRDKEAELENTRREQVARLELELNEVRAESEERLGSAEKERDEALALVASLTRRLQMAGLTGGEPDENLPMSEELKRIRKALWCSEGEIQGLRNLFLSFKDEVADHLTELERLRSRLGSELIES